MPKKNWTPEERKAFAEKMRAAREAKQREHQGGEGNIPRINKVETPQEASETISQGDDIEQMKRQIEELKAMLLRQPLSPIAPQVTARGVVGTLEKFPVDPKHYPTKEEIFERLLQEADLTIQGFSRDWWDINYQVSSVNYDTKDGLNVTEPKFKVELIRIIPDPETNKPSAKRYVLHKLTLFEDPRAAIDMARQYGLEVNESNEKAFLDEMRYLRIRDWVKESFYPPKPTQEKSNKVETVIGNRLVEVFEINSPTPEDIPFDQLQNR